MRFIWSIEDTVVVQPAAVGRCAAWTLQGTVASASRRARPLLLVIVLLHMTLAGYFCAHWCEVQSSLPAASVHGHHMEHALLTADIAPPGAEPSICRPTPVSTSVTPILDMFFPAFDVAAGQPYPSVSLVAFTVAAVVLAARTRVVVPPEAPPRAAR